MSRKKIITDDHNRRPTIVSYKMDAAEIQPLSVMRHKFRRASEGPSIEMTHRLFVRRRKVRVGQHQKV